MTAGLAVVRNVQTWHVAYEEPADVKERCSGCGAELAHAKFSRHSDRA